MVKQETPQRLKGQLVISCQTYEDNLLYGTENMVTMAKCVLAGEAKGIRACWLENVGAIHALTDVPLIGINKVVPSTDTDFYDSVLVTPSYESAVTVVEAKYNVVALDDTLRGRNEKELAELVRRLKTAYPDIVLTADLATVGEDIIYEKAGFGTLPSTSSDYTGDTMHNNLGGPDVQLIRELKSRTSCLVNGEGEMRDSKQLRDIRTAGTDTVTMGSTITSPMKATAYLVDQMEK